MSTRQTSCGVIVTDRERILLGHATRSPRWDIPKGVAELDEGFPAAAAREVLEETGLIVALDELTELGVYPYLRGKDLALFAWVLPQLPDPQNLSCSTQFALANGTLLPEFDRFGVFPWDEALLRVGKNLARVLRSVSLDALHGPSK
jgi:8-oxo-dGTP pyrophosphatase MutT (NUDIX family)